MKIIQNNQSNTLLFVSDRGIFADIPTVRLRQLGSSSFKDIAVTLLTIDCFTASVSFTVDENEFSNGTYILELIDILGEVYLTCTVRVDGYDYDNPRAFVVLD